MIDILKSTASSFTMAAPEATNPVLCRIFANSIPNIIEMAYDVFLYQNRNGYYQVPLLRIEKINMVQNGYEAVRDHFS